MHFNNSQALNCPDRGFLEASAAPEGRKEEKYKWRNKKYEEK
jgi:hypothetical protein